MKKTIKVTKTDIRLGGKNICSNKNCIIARAARRAGLDAVSSGYSTLSFITGKMFRSICLPRPARLIQNLFFDNPYEVALKKAEPFQFTINY